MSTLTDAATFERQFADLDARLAERADAFQPAKTKAITFDPARDRTPAIYDRAGGVCQITLQRDGHAHDIRERVGAKREEVMDAARAAVRDAFATSDNHVQRLRDEESRLLTLLKTAREEQQRLAELRGKVSDLAEPGFAAQLVTIDAQITDVAGRVEQFAAQLQATRALMLKAHEELVTALTTVGSDALLAAAEAMRADVNLGLARIAADVAEQHGQALLDFLIAQHAHSSLPYASRESVAREMAEEFLAGQVAVDGEEA
jgi:hypothetical protein